MYILRMCKYYGFSVKQLELLFKSLIMSLFTFGIELWEEHLILNKLARSTSSSIVHTVMGI